MEDLSHKVNVEEKFIWQNCYGEDFSWIALLAFCGRARVFHVDLPQIEACRRIQGL